ncbi:G-type lectin S-receptor-like serine/threonine-protein kinase [Camellia lanceoleosa]|uniref:G-type lectin S-receptor-like serine/threonine-protein kinase n=1 Tax=Camellia lanceoleosa TaxID=1840588 RepID=A0ACC0G4L7_9ERIC|nr:G-type lectin S-receptor-like serine/threonine-protein kinase [Camellia lanceoleosa]
MMGFENFKFEITTKNSKAYPARNAKQCESACSLNCSCIAYAYNGSECSIWDGALLNLRLSDGNNTTQNLYIKLAASELQDVVGMPMQLLKVRALREFEKKKEWNW